MQKYSKEYYQKNKKKFAKWAKEYYQKNKEKIKKRQKIWEKKNPEKCKQASFRKHQKLKKIVLNFYSNNLLKCACCEEDIYEFLTIDHINDDGAKHRKNIKTGMYRWLKVNNFPKGFQVLCFNCNQAKHIYGVCPHQKK